MVPFQNPHLSVMMLLYAAELAVTSWLFCMRLPRRRRFARRSALCGALALAYAAFAPLEAMRYAIRLPLTGLAFVQIGLCYELDLIAVLFVGVAVYLVQCLESSLNSLLVALDPVRLEHFGTRIQVSVSGYLLLLFSYGITLAVVYGVFVRRMRAVDLRRNARLPVIALSGVVLVMNQFWIFGAQLSGEGYNDSLPRLVDNAWNIVCCILALCVQFGIFDANRKEQELEITRTLMKQKEEQYRTSKSMILAINKKCHALKVKLADLAEGGEAPGRIEEALAVVNSLDAAVHTGNEVLDILFTEKNSYCLQSQITFVSMIDGEKLAFMEAADLYVLFGNIIDNAIAAVRALDDPARRTIYVNVRAEKQLLLIQTENPYAYEPRRRDGLLHGFGDRSIRMIAEKYGGSVNTRQEDGVYYLNVLLPMK